MKTVEGIKYAVIAECERLCPQIGDKSKVEGIDTLRIDRHASGGEILQYTEDYQWEKVIEFNYSDHWREKHWQLAYHLLGLSERDAVADTKAFYESLFAELKQSDLQLVEIYAQAEVGRLQAEKKNAALVAAAELVIKRNWERINGDGSDYSLFSQAIGNLGDALAANEKGREGQMVRQLKKCACCGDAIKGVSIPIVHNQMHRYVCSNRCMWGFYRKGGSND